MKRTLLLAAVFISLGISKAHAGHFIDVLPPASASGCVPVSNGYDYNCTTDAGSPVIQSSAPVQLWARSLAQLNALTPTAAGQIVFCSNCTNSQVCVSSGTGQSAWVAVSSGVVTSAQHCN